jgi:hypothetical protein
MTGRPGGAMAAGRFVDVKPAARWFVGVASESAGVAGEFSASTMVGSAITARAAKNPTAVLMCDLYPAVSWLTCPVSLSRADEANFSLVAKN